VVHRGEQVDLAAIWGAAGAAQGLAVDRDRPPAPRSGWEWSRLVVVGQPPADGQVQRVGVDAGQHAAHGGLVGWPPDPAQGVAAHPERGQDRPGRVSRPLTDRGQGPGAGQHRGDRHRQDRAQRVPSAAALSWVGDRGEVAEQVTALDRRQRDGREGPLRGGGDGR
jgi:hypothetical protein